jgi:CheY-like chemotaxis protein
MAKAWPLMLETDTAIPAIELTGFDSKPQPVVLIVDDDLDSRNFYAHYLTQMGCRVVTAYDGLKAIATAAQCQPDVIVMDLLMPRLDGWEATARLKRSSTTQHIPVIVVSGVQTSRDRARAAGCDGFLAKPCSAELLWWEVRVLLEASAGIHSAA